MLAIEGATKTDLINVKSGKETVVGDLSHCIKISKIFCRLLPPQFRRRRDLRGMVEVTVLNNKKQDRRTSTWSPTGSNETIKL
jgi:hypothetical protein